MIIQSRLVEFPEDDGCKISDLSHLSVHVWKQAERLKSRERRAKVNRLDGQWA